MVSDPFHNVRILTGPTGSGKSQLGVELAERLGAEIISMDSMALYRGMDIGTAKPTDAQRQRVRHHLIDVLDPWESASVAWWRAQAIACCRDIQARGRRVLIVGGTPLYLKALLRGLFDGPAQDEGVRQRLTAEAEQAGPAVLHARLAGVDPLAAARIHPHDRRRLIRALEVWELTGRPISSWQQQWGHPAAYAARLASDAWQDRCLWLDVPRDELYAALHRRVEAMFAAGWVEEVQALRHLPRPLSREAAQALGYKEVLAHVEGRASLAETIALVQIRSRQFAKRQLTWFRNLPECRPASRELTWTLWNETMKNSC